MNTRGALTRQWTPLAFRCVALLLLPFVSGPALRRLAKDGAFGKVSGLADRSFKAACTVRDACDRLPRVVGDVACQ